MQIRDNLWLGPERARFERVRLAFAALGYVEPRQDYTTGEQPTGGAYVCNVTPQYAADLTKAEVLDIIAYALTHSKDSLTLDPPRTIDDVRGSNR